MEDALFPKGDDESVESDKKKSILTRADERLTKFFERYSIDVAPFAATWCSEQPLLWDWGETSDPPKKVQEAAAGTLGALIGTKLSGIAHYGENQMREDPVPARAASEAEPAASEDDDSEMAEDPVP